MWRIEILLSDEIIVGIAHIEHPLVSKWLVLHCSVSLKLLLHFFFNFGVHICNISDWLLHTVGKVA